MSNKVSEEPDKVTEKVSDEAMGEAIQRTFRDGLVIAIVYSVLILIFFGTIIYVVGHSIANWW